MNSQNTLVFIDDSGDAGFKIDKGSSRFFIIAAVIFYDFLEAEKTAISIKELRRKHNFSDTVEYKFNKSRPKIRIDFLNAINKHAFDIRALVVDKVAIISGELRNNKNSFYSYMIKMLLQHSGGTIANASVKIDGSGDRRFRKNFLVYLRKQLNSQRCKVIKKCRLADSKGNVLVQMADMVAGSIHRSHTGKKDKDSYKSIIQKHIRDEWGFR